ncbi:MAG TPA: hypothetical protein VIY72_00940 [Acidimicrobiales bacterium]
MAEPSGERVAGQSSAGRARGRTWVSALCLVLACVVFTVGLLASWAASVVYDSDTFADRSVALLDEPEVRRELADRLTEQLALAGNQQAVNFRPAFQLAVEAAIDTDTFRSIFRTAVKRTHQAILVSQDGDGSALDLSDSVTIIASNLTLPSSAAQGQGNSAGLNNSLGDITQRMSDLRVWSWEDYAGIVTLVGLVGGPVLAAVAIAVSPNRRRTVRRLGWGVVAGGLVLAILVPVSQGVVGSRISDGPLSSAVSAGLGNVMADLRTMGLWVAAYGFLLAAATRAGNKPLPTPDRAWARFHAWVDRRRETTGGTVLVGAGALLGGIYVVTGPQRTITLLVLVAGLWLSYLGVALLTRLVQAVPAQVGADLAVRRAHRQRRLLVGGAIAVVAVLLLGTAAVLTTRGAARAAEAAGAPECNGEAALCDVPINLAMFPGAHNAMSSALYPGWLFAEQSNTLTGQLDAGVRALLIDTHYGVPSTARLPGSETPVIITDRAAELASPPGESYDPAIAARAQQVAANAPPQAGAQRDIYLCHNFCEMGAASFTGQMESVRRWLETNPEEVVILVVEDHTTPTDTAAALEAAGLADRAWALDPAQPMPTLGDLIDAGRNLLVFAENQGPGSPDWYQSAYQWFQETPYAWKSVDEMNCKPNRGQAANKLMLINHWVTYSPPDPGKAGSQVNSADVLKARIEQCLDERGVFPNVVAVDFAERGALMATVDSYNQGTRSSVGNLRSSVEEDADSTGTTSPGGTTPSTLPEAVATSSAFKAPTVITSLTGGNPAVFCAGTDQLVAVFTGWALADLSKPAAAGGLPALTYGPLVDRILRDLGPVTPVELARQLAPGVAQSAAAVDALRQAGFDQAAIDGLADALSEQLAGPAPDLGVAEQLVVDRIQEQLGRDGTLALAQAFERDHPTPVGLFDLGDVSDDVATGSGWGCLLQA